MTPQTQNQTPSRLEQVLLQHPECRKVTELHVHLGGAVPIYRLWEMGIARGIRGVAGSYEDFIRLLRRNEENTGNLERYLEVFDTVELIQAGPSAVAESIRIALNGAYRTGGMRRLGPGGEGGDPEPAFSITRLELRFNPMKRSGILMTKKGTSGLFDVDRIIRAACESAEESEIAYRGHLRTGLIFCFGRDMSWEVNKTLAEKVHHWKKTNKKVIGIDLAGPESAMTLSDKNDLAKMAELYDMAGSDLGRTIHLGETPQTTLETFIQTVKALKPARVSHPIIAVKAFWNDKDARGLELLAQEGICCELCIQSNLLTKAVSSPEEYKRVLETFDKFGIPYTFSTDSPALQLTTLAGELEYLLSHNSITPEQIIKALESANTATFIKET